MAETICGYLIFGGGIAALLHATLGRIVGFHKAIPWQGAIECSMLGELSIAAALLSFGAMLLARAPVWGLAFIVAWLIGFMAQWRDNRCHRLAQEAIRSANAVHHPRIFDQDPPEDLNATDDQTFRLYDLGYCVYLGNIDRSDLRVLIECLMIVPEFGPNDLYMMEESFDLIPTDDLSTDCETLLKRALQDHGDLTLRWIPSSSKN